MLLGFFIEKNAFYTARYLFAIIKETKLKYIYISTHEKIVRKQIY